MKLISARCILIVIVVVLYADYTTIAQNRANKWMIGYNYGNYPDNGLDFSNDSLLLFTVERSMQFFLTDASICDTSGELLFYTNGIYIANRNHDSLLNTHDFNSGWGTDFYGEFGLGIAQGVIIIPIQLNQINIFYFMKLLSQFYLILVMIINPLN
ncbi:MAG: hypothetical protein IPG39_03605 [Bacteroidetes bacterium]|nr:hypothetical protein [Bacteroidota bacterium]